MLKFTRDHEWVDTDTGRVGITDFAQKQLGDVVFVDLPDTGRQLAKGDEVCVIESVKAASEVYSPIGGTITAVNEALTDSPDLINKSPLDEGWIVALEVAAGDLDELMDETGYAAYLEEIGE